MDTAMTDLIIYIAVTMVFSAFFSGMEIAYVSSNRMLAEMTGGGKGWTHRIVSFFYQHPNTYVTTMLVGNNIALVVYGVLIARLFDNTIFLGCSEAFTVPADTLLSSLIVLFTGEFLPKTIFKNNANLLLHAMAFPAAICYIVLFPLSRLCTLISRSMLKVFGVSVGEPKEGGFSKEDLDDIVQWVIGEASDKEMHVSAVHGVGTEQNDSHATEAQTMEGLEGAVKIFQNTLDLPDTQVRDCMIPRTEITAVELETPLEQLRQKFVESGRSKIVVYDGDIDNITGYIHSSELFRLAGDKWQDHVRQMPCVPESAEARKVMRLLLVRKAGLAVVIDEFGGTSGILALEDIVEQLTGEIEDEHDKSPHECRKTNDGGYLVSANLEVEQINETLGINLPTSPDSKTLGGVLLQKRQAFPKPGELITLEQWQCRVLRAEKTRITLVKITPRDPFR